MKMLDTKAEGQNSSEYQTSDYGQQNATAYNHVQQPTSNQYGAAAQGGMAGGASMQAHHNIPEIDIDEDEIPF
jgi:single-stranded DNA-binding protein